VELSSRGIAALHSRDHSADSMALAAQVRQARLSVEHPASSAEMMISELR
jgi:hypothetical protein